MTQTAQTTSTISVTNNSGFDVYALDPTKAMGAAAVSIKALKTADGKTVISTGSSVSLVLDDTYVDDKGNTLPSPLYHFVFSKVDWLMPVDSESRMPHGDGSFESITISADEAAQMQSAFTLDEQIRLYPSSAAAQGYTRALQGDLDAASSSEGAGSQKPSGSQAVRVDAFLKTLAGYEKVKFKMMMAVQTYLDAYPFAWARRQDTMVYYLYSVDGQTPIKAQGTLTLTKTTRAPDITNSDGGYAISYTAADGTKKQLYYVNGQFSDDSTGEFGTISLLPAYVLKGRLTGSTTDNTATTMLTGTLSGVNIIGLDQQQDPSTNDGRGFWQTLFVPHGAQEIFTSIMEIGGFLMLLQFAGSNLWSAGKGVRSGWQDAKERYRKWREKTTGDKTPVDTLTDAQKVAARAELRQIDVGAKTAMSDRLDVETDRIEAMSNELGYTDEPLEEAGTGLQDAYKANQDGRNAGESVSDFIKRVNGQIDQLSEKITKYQSDQEAGTFDDIADSLAAQKRAADRAGQEADRLAEDATKVKTGGEEFDDDVDV